MGGGAVEGAVSVAARMFRGARLFGLKDAHGLPLDFALDAIINDRGMVVEWPGFIEAARAAGWWDYQTLAVMEHALQDAGVARDLTAGIVERAKLYVMAHEHPAIRSKA